MFSGKKNLGAGNFLFPTPLVLCGTYDSDGRPNLAALAWAGLCCSVPPAIQISVRPERHTHAAILSKEEFTVCVPSARQAEQADFCGMTSGRDLDKFAKTGLTPMRGEFVDAPVVDEFPLCLECRLLHRFELGSHDMFVGKILASWFRDDCFGEDGELDPLRLSPIAYAPLKNGGSYHSLGALTGRAFSVGRRFMDEK
jgi:flavin reductase (DIM6/NTAB) family NADH-FMN oxidoreductase RutF